MNWIEPNGTLRIWFAKHVLEGQGGLEERILCSLKIVGEDES